MKVLLLFPLFYSANGLNRLHQYLRESSSSDEIEVAIFCSNPSIEEESRLIAKSFGFAFYKRDNFGGGEGSFFDLFQSTLINENYEVVIYLEESCEPMSSRWIESLVKPLRNGSLIQGWHWNWRGRKRSGAVLIKFGSRFRPAFIYKNAGANHPLNEIIEDNVYDVSGFRHECLAFRLDQLPRNLMRLNKTHWEGVPLKFFGLSMERFFWDNLNPSVIKCPNFQFPMLLKQNRFPIFISTNYFRFRELSPASRMSSDYKPNRLLIRRMNLKFVLQVFKFWSRNIIKFIILTLFLVDKPSKLSNAL